MLTPHKKDVIHKVWLLRLLTAIAEDAYLSARIGFKGGTCAAMRGLLNRFSVDLDFDLLIREDEMATVRNAFEKCFKSLNLRIKDKSKKVPQYFLGYDARNLGERNTIKIDASFPAPKKNKYEMVKLPEIDRTINCQTIETIVSNKLITLIARHERTGKIAGRDIFDIHHFLSNSYPYSEEIIFEQRKESPSKFFKRLIDFVDKKITNTIIDQDLNHLLPDSEFQFIRKILKQETLMLLKNELEKL